MAAKRPAIIRFLQSEYKIGAIAPASAIYKCSECAQITAFKRGEEFLACENDHRDPEQTWYRTNQIVHFATKNLNVEFAKIETIGLRMADFIAEFSGTMAFVWFHVLWFGLWIYFNTGSPAFGVMPWDLYPFGLLTMIVSLEAIILSTFILISQNRAAQKSELRAELDYQTNLKIEKDVAEILSILNTQRDSGAAKIDEAPLVVEEPVSRRRKTRR